MLRKPVTLVLICLLAACSGGGTMPPSPSSFARSSAHSADSPTGLPGDSATGLPGDSATGLPGAQAACAPASASGVANCTIAIDLSVAPNPATNLPAALIPGYHPADLASAYDLPTANAGGTVAIVDAYDDPAAETDLGVYRAAFGLPPCTSVNGCFTKLNQSGTSGNYPPANASWSQEISLDLDMISAVCPHCSIVLVEANSASLDDLGAAVDTAAARHPLAISNSYYATEWSGETSEDVHYQHPGIAITASAGDAAAPFYPAASPYVTAVGGTTLELNGGARSEQPWAYGGQGCSAFESKPSWQSATSCTTRSTVDVAVDANPLTGVAIFDSSAGGWLEAGGTSVGAPLIAAAYALGGQAEGPSFSYAHASSFNAILTPGYTAATGLGSPDGIGGL